MSVRRRYHGLARLKYVRDEMQDGMILFCVLIATLAGLALLLSPLVATDDHSIYERWGTPGRMVFGAVFLALGLWSLLFPEQWGGVATALVVSGVGIASSVHPLSLIGLIFWLVALYVAAREVWMLMRRPPRDDDP